MQLSRWSSVDVLWRWPVSGASRSLRFPTLSESRSACLQRWMKLDDVDAGRVEGTTSDERAELVRLPRELRVAKMAIEILKKASAYIADPCSPRFPTGPVQIRSRRIAPRWIELLLGCSSASPGRRRSSGHGGAAAQRGP